MPNDIRTLLSSDRVEDRKEAIRMLLQQGGDDAMFQLALLYKYDPDPDIRHLAIQAGKYLKQQLNSAEQSIVTTQEVRAVFASRTDDETDAEKPPTTPRKPVTGELKPPTMSRKTSTGELKSPTSSTRQTQEAKPPTASTRQTLESKPPTASTRQTQEANLPPDMRRTQEAKPLSGTNRLIQDAKPSTVSRRTQEIKAVLPAPPADEVELEDYDDEIPDYEYEPVSWQDEDKARGFIAAANMMYDEGKLKAAADYLRRAIDTNPNLRRDDGFISTVARITERPKAVALDQLLNPPEKRTLTQETKSVGLLSGLSFGGAKDARKKKSEPVPGELTWQDVLLDLTLYTVVTFVLVLVGTSVIVQGLREPLNRAVTIVGTFPRNLSPTLEVSTVGQIAQVTHAFASLYSPAWAVGFAFGFAVYSLWSLLLQYVGIHLAATIPLIGTGSFKQLIRHMTWFNVAFNVVGLILLMGFVNGVLMMVVTRINSGALPATADWNALLVQQVSAVTGALCVGGLIALVVSSMLVARVYSFGVGRGCAAQIIGAIIVSLISGAISSLTTPLLGSLLRM